MHTSRAMQSRKLLKNGGQGRNRTAAASLFRAGLGDGHLTDSALLSSIRCTGFSAVYWNHNGTKISARRIRLVPIHSALFPLSDGLESIRRPAPLFIRRKYAATRIQLKTYLSGITSAIDGNIDAPIFWASSSTAGRMEIVRSRASTKTALYVCHIGTPSSKGCLFPNRESTHHAYIENQVSRASGASIVAIASCG